MQVSVESTGNIQRTLTITVPADQIDGEIESRLKSMRGRVKIDGFRPGKVPLSVVSQQYGDSVYQEVLGETFQKTFSAAKPEVIRSESVKRITCPSGEDAYSVYRSKLNLMAINQSQKVCVLMSRLDKRLHRN